MARKDHHTNLVGRRCKVARAYLDRGKRGTDEAQVLEEGEIVTTQLYPDGSGILVGVLLDKTRMIVELPTTVLILNGSDDKVGGTD